MEQTMGLHRGLVATYRRQRLLHALLDAQAPEDEESWEQSGDRR